MSYFKTNRPEAIAEMKAFNDFVDKLKAEADAFAAMFGAQRGLVESGLNRVHFEGLKFKQADEVHWTLPNRRRYLTRQLRTNPAYPAGATKEDRAKIKQQHAVLKARYSAHYPASEYYLDSLYKAVAGIDWGTVFISGIAIMDGGDGFIYIQTSATPKAEMTEILGSEYHLVKERKKAQEAADAESSSEKR